MDKIDRTLLTKEQVNELDMWTELFHGPAWAALVKRHEDTIQVLQQSYHKVEGTQRLGQIQGALRVFYNLFVSLPDVINYEYLIATGQLGQEEKGLDDNPVSPTDWSR